MRLLVVFGSCCLISILYASIIPKEEPHGKRTIDKKLSENEHEDKGEHNPDYDHEAFLGHDEAARFDELSPEESKQKLAEIVTKIDSDNDGFITEDEMIRWIKYIQRSYVSEDAKRQWLYYEKNEGDVMTWEDYAKRTYGENNNEAENDEYAEMRGRDTRRFSMADRDVDGALSVDEFVDFLHPEDAPHMREIVVTETLEDIDKNGDGLVDVAEYVGDMYSPQDGEPEPDWVTTEREHFSKWRDLNHDGVLDREEIRHWIMPDDYDHAQAESKHLIYEADVNKDGMLTEAEVIDKYDLFVGSQATDFGEALTRNHDEF